METNRVFKVSLLYLPFKNKKLKKLIIEKSRDLFLDIGFKSVTMDHIAQDMGISKKTIYNYFKNKTELVNFVTYNIYDSITTGIKQIKKDSLDPINELYDIKLFLIKFLKGEKTSPIYQLQKYYPLIHREIEKKQFEFMIETTASSLRSGIELGLFRKDIHVNFISRLYFIGWKGIKNPSIFSIEKFDPKDLMQSYIEYHLRGIVTEKGLEKLNHFINN